jgi:two-component system, cell cycle sensor histidine kinase and response regulator CckA
MSALPGAESRTILVVDDDESIREIERRYLEPVGYRVLEAANALEAIGLLESGAMVDLVISDLIMPEMGGEEMALRLRINRPALKVLFVTGRIDRVMDARPRVDIEAYLNKPFTGPSLTAAVARLLFGPTATPE